MRVTTQSQFSTTARNLGAALERTQTASQQISSGRRVNAWSDDAPAASSAEAYRNQEADYSSFQRVADDAKGWLATTDGVLQSMSSLMTRVRELAASAQNGSISDTSRTAIVDEINQLRDQLRDYGNTEHLGRPVFGGFGETALETKANGDIEFAGDARFVNRQISPTVVLPVNVDGATLFGFTVIEPSRTVQPSGEDVFTTLRALAEGIRDGDQDSVEQAATRMTGHADAIGMALSFVGATTNRVEAAHDAGGVSLDRLAERRSALEEVDLAEAVLQLNQAQAGYQAALGAAAKSNLPTLADFLK